MPAATVAKISNPAPHFSAAEIGVSVSWIESGALAGNDVATADPTAPVAASLKNVFFKARRVKAPTSTIPAPVTRTATGYAFQTPRRIVISAANPLNPGIPIEAADATTNEKAAKGRSRPRFIVASSF